jgi:hypothetical protein
MFEHLDDPNPPSPDADRKRAIVEGVSRHRRARARRVAVLAAGSALIVIFGVAWALVIRDTTTVVTANSTDTVPLSFCQAAQQIQNDQQQGIIAGNSVVVPNFDADYAALTDAAPDPELHQALHDAAGLLAAPLRDLTPLETHSARIVQEALVSRCGLSTAIFGLIVNRTNVTLPPPSAPTANDQNAFQFALVGFTEAEAQRVAEQSGWTIRVIERDGVAVAATADRVGDRINVAVQDGIVITVSGFY